MKRVVLIFTLITIFFYYCAPTRPPLPDPIVDGMKECPCGADTLCGIGWNDEPLPNSYEAYEIAKNRACENHISDTNLDWSINYCPCKAMADISLQLFY